MSQTTTYLRNPAEQDAQLEQLAHVQVRSFLAWQGGVHRRSILSDFVGRRQQAIAIEQVDDEW